VELEANQTIGTDTIVGPRHAACLHHLFAKLPIRLLFFGAIGGLGGSGVFHALEERYQRPLTHIRLLLRLTFGHRAAASRFRLALAGPSEAESLRPVPSARPVARVLTRRGVAQVSASARLIRMSTS
jgi:hypothetical protein